MTHQPAISFSNSFHFPFNRAGGRTSNVRQNGRSTTNVKLRLSKYLWIAVLLVIGLFYMGLVGMGVGALIELLVNRGIAQPWLGVFKIAGFITVFVSLLYPMYFVRLIEEGLMRHGPVFAKGPFLSQRPVNSSVDAHPLDPNEAE
jgi:hypothetical protein